MQPRSRISALGLVLTFVALVSLARGTVRGAADGPSEHATSAASLRPAPPSGPIDVNTASLDALVALPRIGPALAARIVEDREAHGLYETLDALDRVPGIGPRTIELLRPHAVAAPRRSDDAGVTGR